MPKYKLTIEYDGRGFFGWQFQENQISVQEVLQQAIKAFSGESVVVYGAGRTDTGVHATGQVAHIILTKDWPEYTLMQAMNAHLSAHHVAILSAQKVSDDFDARFSAIERHYRYDILPRYAKLTFQKGLIWQVPYRLDVDKMHEAAQILVGKHDFTTFRASACQAKSPVKTINKITVSEMDNLISIHVSARSFLHNQVRSIVGCLKQVGAGKWDKARLQQALDSKERQQCATLAPPDGLYLERVDF